MLYFHLFAQVACPIIIFFQGIMYIKLAYDETQAMKARKKKTRYEEWIERGQAYSQNSLKTF